MCMWVRMKELNSFGFTATPHQLPSPDFGKCCTRAACSATVRPASAGLPERVQLPAAPLPRHLLGQL